MSNYIHPEFRDEEWKYELCAVVIHSGEILSSGHYFIDVRIRDNEWYRFNDPVVTRLSNDILFHYGQHQTPYMY